MPQAKRFFTVVNFEFPGHVALSWTLSNAEKRQMQAMFNDPTFTALALATADNRPRMNELREFARLIGFNLEEVLARIDEIPPIQPA